MSSPNRVDAGIPAGGQFATQARAESSMSLAGTGAIAPEQEPFTVGAGPEPITVAQARRELPEGSRVQVVYLNGQRPGDDGSPDVRVVSKQTAMEMTTDIEAGRNAGRTSHLRWAKQKTQRDASGNIIVTDDAGHPYVAFIPLADGSVGVDTPEVRVQAADDIRDARTTDDQNELDRLSRSDLVAVRRYVAANPNADSAVLFRLAQDDDEQTQLAAVSHPNATWQALVFAEQSDSYQVRHAVARHPAATPNTLINLARDGSEAVRSAVASHRTTPSAILRQMATGERSQLVQLSVAQNPNSPPDALEHLSRGNGYVMTAVGRNPSTPVSVLERLSSDTSTGNSARAGVAENPSTPVQILHRLGSDEDSWVREHAAKNEALPHDTATALASDREQRVRRSLAANNNVDPGIVAELSTDRDGFVRATAAKNVKMPAERLKQLASDSFHAVRAGVAQNPSTPMALLKQLAGEEGVVGLHASNSIEARKS
ncbi:MAG: hypothetical protein M3Y35_04735 [Actinomycetota bacterium]|nr:hypothetical protein [Actinomycetota bacterium]